MSKSSSSSSVACVVTVTTPDSAGLCKMLAQVDRYCASACWVFGQSLIRYMEADTARKAKDVAKTLSRSASTISKWLSAARAYPSQPTESEHCRAFLDKWNGNSGRTAKGKEEMSADDRLKMIRSLAKSAVKHGVDADAVIAAATEGAGAADETADETAE